MSIDVDELQKRLKTNYGTHRHLLFDARTPERFCGECEPIDRKAGHIPGAINLPWLNNLDINGYFLPTGQLQLLYTCSLGSTAPDEAIFMCGSGVTACHNIVAMTHAGLSGAKLYAGSWSEWITDCNRTIALTNSPP